MFVFTVPNDVAAVCALLAVISKVLGHADYAARLKVYAHLDPQRAKAAARRIDAALGRRPAASETAV